MACRRLVPWGPLDLVRAFVLNAERVSGILNERIVARFIYVSPKRQSALDRASFFTHLSVAPSNTIRKTSRNPDWRLGGQRRSLGPIGKRTPYVCGPLYSMDRYDQSNPNT